MECVLEDAYILVYEKKITQHQGPGAGARSGRQRGQAAADHLPKTSKARPWPRWSSTGSAARSKCCAVKAPGYGDRRKAMLEDIAILTGGTADLREPGHQARKPHADRPGPGQEGHHRQGQHDDHRRRRQERPTSRPASTRFAARSTARTSDYDREKLEERLAKLAGGVAKVNVGAATESEMKEKKARVEDALHATRAAVEEGILPGGGVALLRATAPVKPDGLIARRGGRLQHRPACLPLAADDDRRERRPGRRHRLREGARRQGQLRLQRR